MEGGGVGEVLLRERSRDSVSIIGESPRRGFLFDIYADGCMCLVSRTVYTSSIYPSLHCL